MHPEPLRKGGINWLLAFLNGGAFEPKGAEGESRVSLLVELLFASRPC